MAHCSVCKDDGWIAYPTWANATRSVIRIRKVACPRGCPLADPNEENLLPDFPHDDEVASDC
jgi:hypothetical protein